MIGRFSFAVTPLAAVVLGLGLVAAGPGHADDRADDNASLNMTAGLDDAELAFPEILSAEDAGLYRRIFDVQESGDWKQADRLVARLEDKALMGHVMAQRFLHPTKYRSRYKELKAWMAKYADHPDAHRLYKLARNRQPKNWRAPKPPARLPAAQAGVVAETGISVPGKRLKRSEQRRVRDLKRIIRSRLRRGFTLSVKKLIATKEVKRLFSAAEFDQAKARLGQGYFLAGRDDWALTWSGEAAARSGDLLPEAHWTAGLAAWRLKKIDVAARHFEAIANNAKASSWLRSAGAFWAARAHLVDRRPERVNPYLKQAAQSSRTFYGLLANYMLARPMKFRWAVPPLGEETISTLSSMPRGRRAMALLQIGENRRAERELKTLSVFADETLTKGILALASRGSMPSLAVRLDKRLFPNGGGYDGAAYPLPAWLPKDGLRIDKALIYAMIRQESRFNPKAKSWAGARGLMQLMPRTASFVAQDRRFHRHNGKRRTLFKPEVNLALGQKYIEILLADEKIKGDLFLMAAAWNGGPGNLNKWRRKTEYMNDPLFFIESIPSRETRIFIEKVLSNLWIYRNRLSQPAPSLAAIAEGRWPVYTPLGQEPAEVAESNGSRH
ncbi:MAG: lytic transglycosylase domain-containing protein [Rhodospirillales bacterium]|nr:lytic transglycosylase domain-containing protein [Alphaproteobacteria bacterium]MBL6948091.1 lytic transglycosylase domain-containing protein [Rhodospirillales bacterium]